MTGYSVIVVKCPYCGKILEKIRTVDETKYKVIWDICPDCRNTRDRINR